MESKNLKDGKRLTILNYLLIQTIELNKLGFFWLKRGNN